MATCEICKTKYFSRECPKCNATTKIKKDKYPYKNNASEKINKFFQSLKNIQVKIFQKNESTIYTKTNYWKDENIIKETNKTITIKKIGEHFKKSSREINKIFEELKWIEKRDRWWVLTPAGETKGGKELYNPKNKTKYTVWNENILHSTELINRIHEYKESNNIQNNGYNSLYSTNKKRKMTAKEKKEKGDKYEAFIANYFRKQGYTIWERGKEKGVKDGGIDLIIKKDELIYFIQCKNWKTWKISDKDVKSTQTDVRNYLREENKKLWKIIKNYNSKILYIIPTECLTRGAYTYIKENSDIVEYKVIPMQ